MLQRDRQFARLATAHREVLEAIARQPLGVVQVATVEDHRGVEALLDQVEIRRLELLPLGADDQRVGAGQYRLRRAHQHQFCFVRIEVLGFLHGFGVERAHAGAGGPQFFQQDPARRIAHVVGVGFEGQTPQGESPAAQVAFVERVDTLEQLVLLPLIDRFDRLQQIAGAVRLFGTVDQGAHVLGKARTAITTTRVDEVIADARVGADALAHRFDVGTQVFGQLGDLVDETDLGRQHAVGRVLGQLGATQIHEHDAVMVAIERRIQIAHHVTHLIALATDDDAIRTPAISDGGTFLEKLRVGDDIEMQQTTHLDQGLFDVRAQGIAGAHWHRGFLHQNQRLLTVTGNRIADREHVAQIRRAVFTRRRTHRNERHTAMLHGEFFVAGEQQAFRIQTLAHQAGQPRFENADVALTQQVDLVLVDVHTHHVMPDFGQHSRLHQTDVTAAKYRDFHEALLNADARAR